LAGKIVKSNLIRYLIAIVLEITSCRRTELWTGERKDGNYNFIYLLHTFL